MSLSGRSRRRADLAVHNQSTTISGTVAVYRVHSRKCRYCVGVAAHERVGERWQLYKRTVVVGLGPGLARPGAGRSRSSDSGAFRFLAVGRWFATDRPGSKFVSM